MASIEERVESLVKEPIEKIGYELYDVEYSKEGKDYFLRIYIDKDTGIDLNDCEKVNNAINEILDEADYIKDQYFLEVSSPGIERVLRKDKHLERNIGELVSIKLFKKDENGSKEYQGELKEFDGEQIIIEDDVTEKSKNKTKNKENNNEKIDKNNNKIEIKIERKNIAQIKTIYNW